MPSVGSEAHSSVVRPVVDRVIDVLESTSVPSPSSSEFLVKSWTSSEDHVFENAEQCADREQPPTNARDPNPADPALPRALLVSSSRRSLERLSAQRAPRGGSLRVAVDPAGSSSR